MAEHKRDAKSGKWKQGSFFLEETRSSQRQTALRIRKERKADRLRDKRGQTLARQEQERLKEECIASMHKILGEGTSHEFLKELFLLVSKNSDVTAIALQKLLDEDAGASARVLLTRLLQPNLWEASLPVLHELTLALATSTSSAGEKNYYGRAPLQWKDLFFPEDGSTTIVEALLTISHSKVVFDIIGNIVLYASDAAIRCIIPQYWGVLAGALHHGGSYAVAAILRVDMTHFGMDLLQAMDRPFDETLLQTNDGVCVIQGLSRRERECAELLLNTPSVGNSLRAIIATATDMKILVPALQAVANLELPCDEVLRHVRGVLDAIPAAVVCTAKEKWIVMFVDMLVEGSVLHAWKVEIVYALADFRESVVESFWRNELVEPLVGLMKLHDTAEPSILILDRALRCINHGALRITFEAAGGVELLEERAVELRIAEELIDDLFSDDEAVPPEESSVGFSPPNSTGRGRGKPIPAWMTSQR